jgi:hypothetical protein
MSKFAILALLILNTTACSNLIVEREDAESLYKKENIDEDLRPYVDDFLIALKKSGHLEEFKISLKKLEVKFVPGLTNLQEPYLKASQMYQAGRCFIMGNRVEIDLGYFHFGNESFRQFLIDHELGHCVLKRIHRHAVDGHYSAISTMNNNFPDSDKYSENKSKFRNELFNSFYFHKSEVLTEILESIFLSEERFNEYLLNSYENELNGDSPMQEDLKALVIKYQKTTTNESN